MTWARSKFWVSLHRFFSIPLLCSEGPPMLGAQSEFGLACVDFQASHCYIYEGPQKHNNGMPEAQFESGLPCIDFWASHSNIPRAHNIQWCNVGSSSWVWVSVRSFFEHPAVIFRGPTQRITMRCRELNPSLSLPQCVISEHPTVILWGPPTKQNIECRVMLCWNAPLTYWSPWCGVQRGRSEVTIPSAKKHFRPYTRVKLG